MQEKAEKDQSVTVAELLAKKPAPRRKSLDQMIEEQVNARPQPIERYRPRGRWPGDGT